MESKHKKFKGYIITDMELGDNPDNIILMYEEPLSQLNNNNIKVNKEMDLET